MAGVLPYLPFHGGERILRELISYLNKGLATLIPLAKATIRRWIISAYEEEREKVKEEMETAISNIHISFDMWTSPNYLAMISIFAHYLDKEGIRRNRLIAFKRVLGAHTGENQAALIVETLHEYNITGKTRYFMSDNANNNDACVDQVLKTISPELSPVQRKARRLRCLGHVVNLCARALLIGKESKKTLRKLEFASGGESESMWRHHGPVGKLHNIIKYIRWTPKRREQFAGIRIKGGLAKFDELEVGRDHSSLVPILICLRYVMSSTRNSLLTNNSSSKTMTHVGTVSSWLLDVLSTSENGLLSSATCIKPGWHINKQTQTILPVRSCAQGANVCLFVYEPSIFVCLCVYVYMCTANCSSQNHLCTSEAA